MLPNGVREEELGPIGKMWVRAILAQQEADDEIRRRNHMLIYAYIQFPNGERTTAGTNALVAAYEARLKGSEPSNLVDQDWYGKIAHCWPSAKFGNSLNVAFIDHRGEHLDEVLKGLRSAIPEHVAVHQFTPAAEEVIPPAGSEIPHAAVAAKGVVLSFTRTQSSAA